MIEKNGDLFTTNATYVGHGVNCRGLMGSGIAAEFKSRFPEMHAGYKRRCASGEIQPGGFWVGTGSLDGRFRAIVNLASQDSPGANAHYNYLFSAVQTFAEKAAQPARVDIYGGLVALPEIGCGIGGLEWPKVKAILLCVEEMYDPIEFEVWHYGG